ncbi:MAG: response regulator transcription factor [Paraburkholderia sp.]|uniref:helix-turn-helix transcriptional regulator n=1 Tax=Paraburkholderia sp. TaxID=1926495 RepID=UPI0012123294|nr:response regulator transcription factor [Paraburkholderia sp.]TAM07124.1 MAG: response regulator transcription factor [Paraburkholderia sp.]TAM27486.1 MAG: response regulator transcription factor [Paraburkholderia sp.]
MRFAVFNPDAERREGLKALLRQIDRRARFNDAPDWRSAERVMQRFTPNLFVIDWHHGIRAGELKNFANHHRTLPIAVLVDSAEPPSGVQALLDEGARGIIRRTTDSILIVKLLELILLGGDHLPADVLREPWPSPPSPHSPPPPRHPGKSDTLARGRRAFVRLSPRQEQILRCVHMGSTNKMIARALGISEGTVKIHLTSIFQQLGAPNRAAAVAIYNGLLSNQLEVLRAQGEPAPKPVHGQHGVVPLRPREAEPFRYPLLAGDSVEALPALPIAAEPGCPWGTSGLAQCAEASAGNANAEEDPPATPHAHVSPSNE